MIFTNIYLLLSCGSSQVWQNRNDDGIVYLLPSTPVFITAAGLLRSHREFCKSLQVQTVVFPLYCCHVCDENRTRR